MNTWVSAPRPLSEEKANIPQQVIKVSRLVYVHSCFLTASGLQTLLGIRKASSCEQQGGNTQRLYVADPEILCFHIPPGDLTAEGRHYRLQPASHEKKLEYWDSCSSQIWE